MCFIHPSERPALQRRFHIEGSSSPRPPARAILYCDGGVDGHYRPGIDLQLSHWVPNQTPVAFKADTSTEISLNFVAGGDSDHDLVVNDHADVDGVLAVFTLVAGSWALAHRRTLIQAAEMGDFWAWGEPPAQALFQTLTLFVRRLKADKVDASEIYSRCFDLIFAFLSGESRFPVDPGLRHLSDSCALVERGDVAREVLDERFAQYLIPRHVGGEELARALCVPSFNAPLSSACLLWPHVRARFDRERVHLVSVESDAGWYHDVWYPGYAWADTPHSWRPPGLRAGEDSNAHLLESAALADAASELARLERGSGRWELARRLTPFATLEGRGFPIVLSFIDQGRPAPSSLSPALVGERLARAIGDEERYACSSPKKSPTSISISSNGSARTCFCPRFAAIATT